MKVFKAIWNAITWILVLVCVLFIIAIAGVRVVGIQPIYVLSASMEPALPTGCTVYVKDVPFEEIAVGDIITFQLNETTKGTHRVIEVDEQNKCFYTKGDNNDDPDHAPVQYANVVGKVVYHIPYLGYITEYIKNPPGLYIAIAGAGFLFLMLFVPDLLTPSEEEKKAKEELEQAKENESKALKDLEDALAKTKQELAESQSAEQQDGE